MSEHTDNQQEPSGERGTLVIPGIDKDLLEKQRHALIRTVAEKKVLPEDVELLDGLLNMLDAWSDAEYYQRPEQQ